MIYHTIHHSIWYITRYSRSCRHKLRDDSFSMKKQFVVAMFTCISRHRDMFLPASAIYTQTSQQHAVRDIYVKHGHSKHGSNKHGSNKPFPCGISKQEETVLLLPCLHVYRALPYMFTCISRCTIQCVTYRAVPYSVSHCLRMQFHTQTSWWSLSRKKQLVVEMFTVYHTYIHIIL